MLTAKEREGLKAILEKLDNDTLASLSGTTTKGMIKPETKDEAITIILMYSENAYSLLKRRKIKKEILFHYLKDNNVAPSPAGDKSTYVVECLKLWHSDVDYDNVCEVEDIDVKHETSYPPPEAPSYNGHLVDTSVSTRQQTIMEAAVQQQVSNETPSAISGLERMGQEFIAWFYQLLNNVNTEPAKFHSDHFWPDCIMQLQISVTDMELQQLSMGNASQTHNWHSKEQALGAQNVTNMLTRLIATGKLIFQPNSLPNGISADMERHGLVRIAVSGILYQGNLCVGLFDQLFGLVRSASSENWKIKYIELMMKLRHTYLMIS